MYRNITAGIGIIYIRIQYFCRRFTGHIIQVHYACHGNAYGTANRHTAIGHNRCYRMRGGSVHDYTRLFFLFTSFLQSAYAILRIVALSFGEGSA